MKERVLIVIPAYNEEKTIAAVIHDLRREVPEFDRVVVNDGSKDKTGSIVTQLGEKQLNLPCNLGYGYALQTGFKYALICGYDIIVSIDADGQHRPADVKGLCDLLLESEADIVIGSRFCDGGSGAMSMGRRLGTLFFSQVSRLLIGQRINDTTSGFKAMRASACKAILNSNFMDFHIETIVQLYMLGFRIRELPVTMQQRMEGSSMHTFASLFVYPLKTLLLTVVIAMDILLKRRST